MVIVVSVVTPPSKLFFNLYPQTLFFSSMTALTALTALTIRRNPRFSP
jgi:hypothetical protein